MRRHVTAGLAGIATALLAAGVAATPASGAPQPKPTGKVTEPSLAGRPDNLPNPLAEARTEAKKEAIAALLSGKVKTEKRNGSEVIRLQNKRFVEYRQPAKEDPILSILVEFGDQIDPATGGTPGPVHNQIPARDRKWDGSASDDNSTIWTSDFNRAYYMELMYSQKKPSMRDFYLKQSGGKYTVGGDVSDWVKVPYNVSRYGSNNLSDAEVYWPFVKDTAQAWYEAQVRAGKTKAEIQAYLKKFDIWDRYDHDNDGNFNEPDGYIDHFQAIHAGEGEEAGGGAQGADQIWSHRWYAYSDLVGSAGPEGNLLGGVPIGDSGIWIGDYTTEPENGGLGVFAHEYGHDLGLPDLYDTQAGGIENGTGFWSLMSAGSWLSDGKIDTGSKPSFMGPWEKLFLGWLNHYTIEPNSGTTYSVLGPAGDADGPRAQAVVVNLPEQTVTDEYNKPFEGEYEWWGGSADNLNVSLTRDLDLTGATTASVTAKLQYEIEAGYDYLFGEVSSDGGTTWSIVPWKTVDGDKEDSGDRGLSGSSAGAWVDLSYDLSAHKGKAVKFRFRYATDVGVHYAGAFLDNITFTKDGATVWTDTVETADSGWTNNGWKRFTGTDVRVVPHFYIAENRTYYSYDDSLRTGPYNYGWANTKPDWVERFSNPEGLLVWYVNYAYGDNNTSVHPGYGLALPVDVRPGRITVPGVGDITNRRSSFDATFGKQKKKAITLHLQGKPVTVPAMKGVPVFDDSNPDRYWTADNPRNSVKVAGSGTRIEVFLEARNCTDVIVVKTTN